MNSGNSVQLLDKPLLCNQCGGIFTSNSSLKTHNCSDHEERSDKDTNTKHETKKTQKAPNSKNHEESFASHNEGEENMNAENSTVKSVKSTTSRSISNQATSGGLDMRNKIEETIIDPWITLLAGLKDFFTDQHAKQKLNNPKKNKSKLFHPKKSKMELYKIKLLERKEANIKKKEEDKRLRLKQINDEKQERITKHERIMEERKEAYRQRLKNAREDKLKKFDEEKLSKQKFIDDKRKEKLKIKQAARSIKMKANAFTKTTMGKEPKGGKSYPRTNSLVAQQVRRDTNDLGKICMVPQPRRHLIRNVYESKPRKYDLEVNDYFREKVIKTEDGTMKHNWIQSTVQKVLDDVNSISTSQHIVLNELYGGVQPVKELKCKMCPSSFKNSGSLQSHFKIKHEKRLSTKCAQCNTVFDNPSIQRSHKKEFHPKTIIKSKCNLCAKEFDNQMHLNKHRRGVHDGDVTKCKFCDKSFSFRENMVRHMRQVHTDLKPFGCKQCDSFFGDSGNLKRHMRTVHMKERIPCQICNKPCSDLGVLSCHIMEKHSEPLVCKECKIDFKSLSGLKIHKNKIHTEIPTEYPCYDCDLSFLSSTDRYGHKVKVHRVGKEPEFYKCRYCPEQFKTAAGRKEHILTHPQAEYKFPCQYCGVKRQSQMRLDLHQKQCIKAKKKTPVVKVIS